MTLICDVSSRLHFPVVDDLVVEQGLSKGLPLPAVLDRLLDGRLQGDEASHSSGQPLFLWQQEMVE